MKLIKLFSINSYKQAIQLFGRYTNNNNKKHGGCEEVLFELCLK